MAFTEIQLDENFTIKPDSNNFTLLKHKATGVISDTTGKEIISMDQWYPPTLKDALKTYLRESLRESESIEDVIKRIEEVETKIDNLKIK